MGHNAPFSSFQNTSNFTQSSFQQRQQQPQYIQAQNQMNQQQFEQAKLNFLMNLQQQQQQNKSEFAKLNNNTQNGQQFDAQTMVQLMANQDNKSTSLSSNQSPSSFDNSVTKIEEQQ